MQLLIQTGRLKIGNERDSSNDDTAINWLAVFHFDNLVTSRIKSLDFRLSRNPETSISRNIIIIEGKKISSEDVKPWGFKSIKDMSKSISDGDVALKNIEGLKPFFRLSPPKGGYKVSTRRSSGQGGVLGQYPKLLTLTERMLET